MEKYMRLAIDEARRGIISGDGGPFGAVIVKNGEVISSAHNEVILQGDPTCHGEVLAIRRAAKKLGGHSLKGCEIYTTGEPCPMCLGAIRWANIDRVYYGCNIEDTEKIGFRDKVFYEAERDGGYLTELLRDECLSLYEEYLKIEEKENY